MHANQLLRTGGLMSKAMWRIELARRVSTRRVLALAKILWLCRSYAGKTVESKTSTNATLRKHVGARA
eukprot:1690495-Amphidinium_carterae.1